MKKQGNVPLRSKYNRNLVILDNQTVTNEEINVPASEPVSIPVAYKRNMELLQKEVSKKNPNKDVVHSLLDITFTDRKKRDETCHKGRKNRSIIKEILMFYTHARGGFFFLHFYLCKNKEQCLVI